MAPSPQSSDPRQVLASRRSFMAGVSALTGLAALSQIPLAGTALGAPRPRSGENPFKLGVASGDPHPNGFVMWTRLVPELFSPDGGMPSRQVPGRLEGGA